MGTALDFRNSVSRRSFNLKSFILLTIIGFTSCVPSNVSAKTSPKGKAMSLASAVESIRASVVQITFVANDLSEELRKRIGKPYLHTPIGTGFLVNRDGYVITARHVIEGGLSLVQDNEKVKAGRKRLLIGIAQPLNDNFRGNFSLVEFDVVGTDARHDLALLKLKLNPFKGEVRTGIVVNGKEVPLLFETASLRIRRPVDGEDIGVSGYPLQSPVLVTKGGWVASSWSYDVGMIEIAGAPPGFSFPDIADSYLADIDINPGNSGGPVYSKEDAAVIGVAVAVRNTQVTDEKGLEVPLYYSSGLAVVVPSRYVVDLLKTNGATWTQTTN